MKKEGKSRKKRIKQLKEEYLQARDISASDGSHLAIRTFMDYFGKWKVLVTLLTVLGFALGIFVVVDRVFFHQAPEPYKHEFAADKVGFKKPQKVLTIHTPERRKMVKEAIEEGYVVNKFKLDPMKDEGLYLSKTDYLNLLTSKREGNINKMALVPLESPIPNENPLFGLDTMAYYGPRALQTIESEAMIQNLLKAENVLYKDGLILGGMLSLTSKGDCVPYRPQDIPNNFSKIVPFEEGYQYLKAQVDINNPNADELLKEYQEQG